jgi:hypothetical protein
MKIENLKPGMTVWEVGRYKVGNTTLRSVGAWSVFIVSVDEPAGKVLARWNGNEIRPYFKHTWSKWRLKRPTLVKQGFNQYRLARRGEIGS